LEKSIFLSR